MSYTNTVGNIKVHVECAAHPQETYDMYKDKIEEAIKADGYIPKTSMENLIVKVVLSFDCDDNYGEYNPATGFGGYGTEFTFEECLRYVEESGGWSEFDYEC